MTEEVQKDFDLSLDMDKLKQAAANDAAPDQSVDETEEVAAEAATESVDEETNEVTEDVLFDFHGTNASVQNLVSKFDSLSEVEKEEKIANLEKSGRKKELAALKDSHPDYFAPEQPAVDDERITALEQEIANLKRAVPDADERLRNSMLKDMFGGEYDKLLDDAKFLGAYDKYSALPMEDRLEAACLHSKTARKLMLQGDLEKETRSANASVPGKGSKATPKEPNFEYGFQNSEANLKKVLSAYK